MLGLQRRVSIRVTGKMNVRVRGRINVTEIDSVRITMKVRVRGRVGVIVLRVPKGVVLELKRG